MQGKRCAACDSINREDALYCEKCGKFLLASAGNERYKAPRSIWENGISAIGQTAGKAAPATAAASPAAPDIWAVICPDCGKRLSGRGSRPIFCPDCNHVFSASDSAASGNRSSVADARTKPSVQLLSSGNDGRKQGGPLRRGGQDIRDRSSLRLIGADSALGLVMPVQESGMVFGSGVIAATAALINRHFQGLEAKQLFFWHTDSGWYVRALAGVSIHNGGMMDIGASHPVLDGDTFEAGDCMFRAEVVPSRG